MRTGNGIIIAQDGKSLRDELAYDSTLSQLIIDAAKSVKHMDVFEIKGAPAVTSYANSTGGTLKEEVWKIKHGLPFIPRVAVYMNIRDAAAAQAAMIGDYTSRVMISTFPVNEAVYYRVDEEYLYLMHLFAVPISGAAGSTSSAAQDMLLRVKYMIFNNIGSLETYEGDYYGL